MLFANFAELSSNNCGSVRCFNFFTPTYVIEIKYQTEFTKVSCKRKPSIIGNILANKIGFRIKYPIKLS
jgi:hypothetical protein